MSDFWAKKLAPTQAPASRPTPQPRITAWWNPETAAVPVAEEVNTRPPIQAKSARETERCPECDSGNYMVPPGTGSKTARCLACGYPVLQSGSGPSAPSTPGQTSTPAKQLDRVKNSTYNGSIIAHI